MSNKNKRNQKQDQQEQQRQREQQQRQDQGGKKPDLDKDQMPESPSNGGLRSDEDG